MNMPLSEYMFTELKRTLDDPRTNLVNENLAMWDGADPPAENRGWRVWTAQSGGYQGSNTRDRLFAFIAAEWVEQRLLVEGGV